MSIIRQEGERDPQREAVGTAIAEGANPEAVAGGWAAVPGPRRLSVSRRWRNPIWL